MIQKKFYIFISAFSLLFLATSCFDSFTGSNGTSRTIDMNEIIYTGITTTNEVGDVLSVQDDDWGCSDTIGTTDTTFILPTLHCFGPAYPNPFNGSVTIPFTVAIRSYVTVSVIGNSNYSVELVADTLAQGVYIVQWNSSGLPIGIYRSTIEIGSWQELGDLDVR